MSDAPEFNPDEIEQFSKKVPDNSDIDQSDQNGQSDHPKLLKYAEETKRQVLNGEDIEPAIPRVSGLNSLRRLRKSDNNDLPTKIEVVRKEVVRNLSESKVVKFYKTKPLAGVGGADNSLKTLSVDSLSINGQDLVNASNEETLKEILVRVPTEPDSGAGAVQVDGQEVKMYTDQVTRGSTLWAETVVDGVNYAAVVTKGDGSHKAFAETGSHFSRKDKRWGVTRDQDKGLASGYMTKKEAVIECAEASDLAADGYRVRVPIKAYPLESIVLDGVQMESGDFVDLYANGDQEEVPYVVDMVVRSPFRLPEVVSMVYEAVDTGNVAALELLMNKTLDYLKNDTSETYKKLNGKWKDRVADQYTVEDIGEFLSDFSSGYLEEIGIQFGRLHNEGKLHGIAHTSNTTFLAEMCDLSHVESGVGNAETLDEASQLYEHAELLSYAISNFKNEFFDEKVDREDLSVTLKQVLDKSYGKTRVNVLGQDESIASARARYVRK